MENFDFTNIFIWGGLLLGGYLFGILDGKFSTWFKKEREEQAEKAEKAAEVHKPIIVEDRSALRVMLEPEQLPRLVLDGQGTTPADMTPEQRKRLIQILVQIKPWIDGTTPAPVAPQPATPPAQATTPPAMQRPIAPPVATVPPITLAPEPTTPRIDIVRGLRGAVVDGTLKKANSAPKTLVGMINDILQAKLANSPFAGKPISMEDGPGGEVMVVVGIQRFNGIDSVPDPEIQALIRESVAEWEKRSG